jgi:hypothetical protein
MNEDKPDLTGTGQRLRETATIKLAAHPTSPRAAREFVARTLGSWGWTDEIETAVLLTSEIVTHAVMCESDVVVSLRGEDSLKVTVSGRNIGRPQPMEELDLEDTDAGLWLVEALAASWGVSPHERGEEVWFEVAPA